MIKILSKRERITNVRYMHQFSREESPGSGFSFECDKDGEVFGMEPEARKSYMDCLTGVCGGSKMIDEGIVKHEHSYMQPAIGECTCGQEVVLRGFTNTCECGKDYNSSGQGLAPRSGWGEETGESLGDILNIP